MHVHKILLVFLPAMACLWLGGHLLYSASKYIFFKSEVLNITDRQFFMVERPPGFIPQDSRSRRMKEFRDLIFATSPLIFGDRENNNLDTLQAVTKIRHWVTQQQPPWAPFNLTLIERSKGDIEDPFAVLAEQRQSGAHRVCRRASYLLVGALESFGIDARVIVVGEGFLKFEGEGHVMTEAWIPEIASWVLVDPLFDTMYRVDDKPASALRVFEAVKEGHSEGVSELSNNACVVLNQARISRLFRHLFISTTNAVFDGYRVSILGRKRIGFAHFSAPGTPDYPSSDKYRRIFVGCFFCLCGTIALSWLCLRIFFVRRQNISLWANDFKRRPLSARIGS